jgi:peptidoglycan/LPS O-acetylase OafA/YrhL
LSLAGIDGVALVVLTPCRLDALSVGAFLAIFVRTFGVDRLLRRASGALAVLSIAVLLTSLWHASTQLLTHIVLPLRGSLVAGCFGALLVTSLGGARRTWRARLLESAGLRFLGKYSYGLYVFHGIIAYAMHDAGVYQGVTARVGSSLLALVLCASAGTGASLVLAVASYELFEKRFLRLKGWLAPSREAGDGLAAATGTT